MLPITQTVSRAALLSNIVLLASGEIFILHHCHMVTMRKNFSSDKTRSDKTKRTICRVSTTSHFAQWSSCVRLLACFTPHSVGGRHVAVVWKKGWGVGGTQQSWVFIWTDRSLMCWKREGWSGGKDSVGKPSTRSAHTYTPPFSTFAHEGAGDGKSFQLSVGVFVCWLQIAKRAQRLYIALNLRLSFVETSSGYLFSAAGGSGSFAWLVSDWLVDWRPLQPSTLFHSFGDCFSAFLFERRPVLPSGQRRRKKKKRVFALSHKWQSHPSPSRPHLLRSI